jgi:hypothetical protein
LEKGSFAGISMTPGLPPKEIQIKRSEDWEKGSLGIK